MLIYTCTYSHLCTYSSNRTINALKGWTSVLWCLCDGWNVVYYCTWCTCCLFWFDWSCWGAVSMPCDWQGKCLLVNVLLVLWSPVISYVASCMFVNAHKYAFRHSHGPCVRMCTSACIHTHPCVHIHPHTHTESHSEHHFPAPSSKLCQIWLRHWRGTLNLPAAVHRRGQRPLKGLGTDKTVEAT